MTYQENEILWNKTMNLFRRSAEYQLASDSGIKVKSENGVYKWPNYGDIFKVADIPDFGLGSRVIISVPGNKDFPKGTFLEVNEWPIKDLSSVEFIHSSGKTLECTLENVKIDLNFVKQQKNEEKTNNINLQELELKELHLKEKLYFHFFNRRALQLEQDWLKDKSYIEIIKYFDFKKHTSLVAVVVNSKHRKFKNILNVHSWLESFVLLIDKDLVNKEYFQYQDVLFFPSQNAATNYLQLNFSNYDTSNKGTQSSNKIAEEFIPETGSYYSGKSINQDILGLFEFV